MDGVVVRIVRYGNNPPQSCGIKGVKTMAIDLIISFIKAGQAETLAFKALALANLNKTVNDIVSLILNHSSKENNTPRWVKDEKGCGKKAGTAKSLATIKKIKDWQTLYPFAYSASKFENSAGHYEQTDKKKFKTRAVKNDAGETVRELKFKKELTDAQKKRIADAKAKAEAETNATTNAPDATRAIPVGTLSQDMQLLIDVLKPVMTEDIRKVLLEITGKHDMDVKIEAI